MSCVMSCYIDACSVMKHWHVHACIKSCHRVHHSALAQTCACGIVVGYGLSLGVYRASWDETQVAHKYAPSTGASWGITGGGRIQMHRMFAPFHYSGAGDCSTGPVGGDDQRGCQRQHWGKMANTGVRGR